MEQESKPLEAEPPPPMTVDLGDAADLYILMKREYRISRNIRASWFFNHLNTSVEYVPKEHLDDFTEELGILSVVPKDLSKVSSPDTRTLFRLTPTSRVTFLARRYRLVFTLDLSPTAASVDVHSGQVLYDKAFQAFKTTLKALIRPFHVPNSKLLFAPQLYITVIAYTPIVCCQLHQILVQGYGVTPDNVETFLDQIHQQLMDFEKCNAVSFSDMKDNDADSDNDDIGLTGGLFDDIIERPDSPAAQKVNMVTPDAGFVNMLRYGILALQLLPENTSAGIVLITDGVIGLPDMTVLDALLSQLRNSTVACSFINIGGQSQSSSCLGYIPYTELMQFIATATFGAYLAATPCVDESSYQMNVYHQALFTWSFQKGLEGFKIDNLDDTCCDDFMEDQELAWTHRTQTLPGGGKQICDTPLLRKKHIEYTYNVSIFNLMSVRLREGYTIKDVNVGKGETQLEVKMVLPWSHDVKIEYIARSSWPLSLKHQTHIEVIMEATYEFLHDVTCPRKIPFKSLYRAAVVNRFWQSISSLSQTDQLLVHLQSFPLNTSNFSIPESIKNGMPLFYLPPNSKELQLSIQINKKDNVLSQFASFWKPIVMLDINIWQKWMHTHRIGIILEHDMPTPKYLHIPNSSGRFNTIQCRQAITSLNELLKDWTTFVLMENHSYVKYLYDDPDKPPTSFFLVRVTSKPPCMVLRLAFLGGTPGYERNEIVNALISKILSLNFPKRGTSKDEKSKALLARRKSVVTKNNEVVEHKPPLQRAWSEICCCIILGKPVEKLLIRYENKPRDFMVFETPKADHPSSRLISHSTQANQQAFSMFTALSRYQHHQRWVWSIQNGTTMPISMQAIGRVLSTLAKIRLQEGFHFAHTSSGIINMVCEIDMTNHSHDAPDCPESCQQVDEEETHGCVLQYIIFPPHVTTHRRESMSEDELLDDNNLETTEVDGELQIVTECWIEPQYGVVSNSTPERSHFDGLRYWEIPYAIYPKDLECISNMVTFEHLALVSQSLNMESPTGAKRPIRTPSAQTNATNTLPNVHEMTINYIPFTFDLAGVLPKCQQVEMLFSTYLQDTYLSPRSPKSPRSPRNRTLEAASSNNTLFDLLLEKIEALNDKELTLSDLECGQFLLMLSDRERSPNHAPLPFSLPDDFRQKIAMKIQQHSVEETMPFLPKRQGSIISTDTLYSIGSVQSLLQSCPSASHTCIAFSKMFDRQATQQSDSADSLSLSGRMESSKTKKLFPRWRCYVRMVSETNLILTFMPATYSDLQSLMQIDTVVKDVKKSKKQDAGKTSTDVDKKDRSGVETNNVGAPTNPFSGKDDCPVKLDSSHDSRCGDLKKTLQGLDKEVFSESSVHSFESTKDESGSEQKEGKKVEIGGTKVECLHLSDFSMNLREQKEGVILPVYVYNMSLNKLVKQLENRWTETTCLDLYEDYTFQDSLHEHVYAEDMAEDDQDNVSETSSERWRQSPERSSVEDGLNTKNTDIKQHCTVISDAYLRCFVTGVFKSLQLGQKVEYQDVESAINRICEELLPMEIDITHFLETVCGHIRQYQDQVRMDALDNEQYFVPNQPSDILEDSDNKSISSESDILQQSSSPSDTKRASLRFPLSFLQGSRCEAKKGMHDSIKNKFTDILKKCFKPVTPFSDYFFYCPSNYQQITEELDASKPSAGGQTLDNSIDMRGITTEESDYFITDVDDNDTKASDKDSVKSNLDSESLSSILQEDLESVVSLSDDNDEMSPLFVHLTCSLSFKSKAGSLRSVPVKSLPICLCELQECLEGFDEYLDLNDLHFTIDIICLTLPQDQELSLRRRPMFNRFMSYEGNSPTVSESGQDHDELLSMVTSTDAALHRNHTGNPLKNLPSFQHENVAKCIEEIQWLLKDEIASALHYVQPVTSEMLSFIAEQVSDSRDRDNCTSEELKLQFVYGPDQSMTKFVEEFEKMNIPGYHLSKEGTFYYLVLDKRHANTLYTAKAIHSALIELSQEEEEPQSNTMWYVKNDDILGSPMELPKDDVEGKNEEIVIPGVSLTRPSPLREQIVLQQQDQGALSLSISDSYIRCQDDQYRIEEGEATADVVEREASGVTFRDDDSIKVLSEIGSVVSETEELPRLSDVNPPVGLDIAGKPRKKTPPEKIQEEEELSSSAERRRKFGVPCGPGRRASMPLGLNRSTSSPAEVTISSAPLVHRKSLSNDSLHEELADVKVVSSVPALIELRRSSTPVEDKVINKPQRPTDLNRCKARSPADTKQTQSPNSTDSPRSRHSSGDVYDQVRRGSSHHDSSPHFPGQVVTSSPVLPEGGRQSRRLEGDPNSRHPSGSGRSKHSSGETQSIRSKHLSGSSQTSSRHPSAPQTPRLMSGTLDTSSQGSYTEEGYEGDSSEDDLEDALLSVSDGLLLRQNLLHFWLIMQIHKDKVDIFYHTRARHLDDTTTNGTNEQHEEQLLYKKILTNVQEICRVVNQMLLLDDLHNTRMCNALLVEDVRWKEDIIYAGANPMRRDSDEEDEMQPQDSYLAASMQFMPGHFTCQCVWQYHFALHPRLKTARPSRAAPSRGIQALRTVLNAFSVNNRKNLFVYRESSGNVFYLRLNESMCQVTPMFPADAQSQPDEEFPLESRSSSMLSIATRKTTDIDEEILDSSRLSVAERDRDSGTAAERRRLKTNKIVGESVTLSVHGITQAGPEICEEFVQVLQNRLDECVLDVITLMLERNPMCKLTPEDVQFIQRPFEDPDETIQFTIPTAAHLQLDALRHYLRQNLLQFLHTPKYAENKEESHFQDFSSEDLCELSENDVFLYNRPPASGRKGIACLHLSLVDGQGSPVHLISCPKPKNTAFKESIDSGSFDTMTSTTRYSKENSSPGKFKPGPIALVQFRLWVRGDVDMVQLSERLHLALRHATYDIILEYTYLTAPICDVPQHYPTKTADPGFHFSAPPSPMKAGAYSGAHNIPIMSAEVKVPTTPTHKKTSIDNLKTSKEFSTFSNILDALKGKPSSPQTPGPETNNAAVQKTWADAEIQRRREVEWLQRIQKFEAGDRGSLCKIYTTLFPEWIEYGLKLGVPSLNKVTSCLLSRFSVDFALKEVQAIVNNLCSDTALKIFRMADPALKKDSSFLPYHPARMPLQSSEHRKESSVDSPTSMGGIMPGKALTFCGVARNVQQWRASVEYQDVDDDSADLPSLTNPKTHKSYQKFQPYDSGAQLDRGLETSTMMENHKITIPRQRLVLLVVRDRELTIYAYNWASDLWSSFERSFMQLVQWQIARSHLLSNVLSQKMGLFHHKPFSEFIDPNTMGQNPYTQNTNDVDLLVRFSSPPLREMQARSSTTRPSPYPAGLALDKILQDSKPAKPLQKMSNFPDPVCRHGMQMLEVRAHEKKESEKRLKLQTLYILWQQRSGHSHVPIAEDVMELLKHSSRLIHYVTTPILFNPEWRRKILAKPPVKKDGKDDAPGKTRSRHGSGSSIKGKKSGLDVKMTPSPDISKRSSSAEEAWHVELRNSMMQEYIQYLQSLQFIQVQMRPASPKRSRPSKSDKSGERRNVRDRDRERDHFNMVDYSRRSNAVFTLQKTFRMPGGIILVELSYRDMYFCVKLFAYESARLPLPNNAGPQTTMFFTDECDKCKDQIHVHSFAHDFHLRTVQSYIGGRQFVLNKDYHLCNFIEDFIRFYPNPPSYARNYAFQSTNVIEDTKSPAAELFDYMLKHEKQYNMRALQMVPMPNPDADLDSFYFVKETEYALVSISHHEGSFDDVEEYKQKKDDYNVSMVVYHDQPASRSDTERSILALNYYILLTSKRELFPKLQLEKKLSLYKSPKTIVFPADNPFNLVGNLSGDSPLPVTRYIGLRGENVNYLGLSNNHQAPLYKLMEKEIRNSSLRIEKMVENVMAQCRRDTMWQRMLIDVCDDEKRKKRSDTADSTDRYLAKLSFDEFEELLSMVVKVPLDQVDSRLNPFLNMSIGWYQGLMKVLISKHPEMKRLFASADGHVQYLVILNPNYLDTLMLLSVDTVNSKAELCNVFREEALDLTTTLTNSTSDLHTQIHIENLVNACCYHMWSGLV